MAGKLVPLKKVVNGVLYTNGMLRIDNVIASYPHLDKPSAGDDPNATPKYSIQGLANKDTHAEVIALGREVLKKIMDEKKLKIGGDKLFMKDGDKWFEGKDECANCYVFTAREADRPTLRMADGTKLDPKEDLEEIKNMFYGGCVVSILINPWVQDNKYGKRINANLRTVKFVEDGTPFGEGRVDDEDAWDDEGGNTWGNDDNNDDDDI